LSILDPSPEPTPHDLKNELMNAIMGALDAHTSMSTQALNSESVRMGMKEILLNYALLYEGLR
jgi:type I restriction enzyme R subunit